MKCPDLTIKDVDWAVEEIMRVVAKRDPQPEEKLLAMLYLADLVKLIRKGHS